MGDLSDIDLENLTRIVGQVVAERVRQVTVHDRTRAVDDSRTMAQWSWLLLSRVTDLAHPFESAHIDVRRELLEIAAVAVAALEAHDRGLVVDAEIVEPDRGWCGHAPVQHETVDMGGSTRGVECTAPGCSCLLRCWGDLYDDQSDPFHPHCAACGHPAHEGQACVATTLCTCTAADYRPPGQ